MTAGAPAGGPLAEHRVHAGRIGPRRPQPGEHAGQAGDRGLGGVEDDRLWLGGRRQQRAEQAAEGDAVVGRM